jgi:hypothetical protein
VIRPMKGTKWKEAQGGTVGWGTALPAWMLRGWFPMVSLEFFVDIILVVELWPWDQLTSNNEYQEHLLGSNCGHCIGPKTLPPSCADGLEIWEPQPLGTEFFIDIILVAELWPWGRLSLQQKWVPGIFPLGGGGGKVGWYIGLTTLPPSCAKCLEIWES